MHLILGKCALLFLLFGEYNVKNKKNQNQRWILEDDIELDTVRFRIKVPRRHIGYVNAIVEGYDNLARVQTEHVQRGVMLLETPRSSVDVLQCVLKDISRKVDLQYLKEEQPNEPQ